MMSRELTQIRKFLDIPAPTTADSASKASPPATGPTLPDGLHPPPLAIVTTSDPAATESRIPPPPAPVLPTSEQPQIEESQPSDSQQITAGETTPLPDDPADWAAYL